jgi:chromosome segregation ATPase
MAMRLMMILAAASLATLLVSCSDDSATPEEAVCDNLDALREDFDELREAVRDLDRTAAQDALEEARGHLTELREAIQDSDLSTAVSQSAADLAAAVDGLQTTVRQVGQGGGSLQGILQQLEIQLAALNSSFTSVRNELASLRCD